MGEGAPSIDTLDAASPSFGRYTLVAKLATGGMAEIFFARYQGVAGFERPVVIKRILPNLAEDASFVSMFLDEARIVARLTHPNVCQVYELGRIQGRYFIAMEYLDGVPLSTLLRKVRQEPRAGDLRLVAGLFAQACEGLHQAHELKDLSGEPLNLVHRDVSPQNLFVTVDGVLKVLDFGVAKAHIASAKTRTGTLKGKYPYMSPEQLRGEALDRRADVFALGVVLFGMVTGRHLFKRDTEYLMFKAITEEPIPPVTKYRQDVPPALVAAILRAVARDREQRFATARLFGEEVSRAVQPLGPPLGQAALAEEVQALCREEIEERRAKIARGEAVAAAGRDGADTLASDPGAGSDPVATLPTVAPPSPGGQRSRVLGLVLGGCAIAAVAALGGHLMSRRAGQAVPAVATAPATAPAPREAPPSPGAAPGPAVAAPASAPVTAAVAAPPVAAAAAVAAPAAPRRPAPAAAPGFFTVDSHPYATIFVDGKKLGETPLIREKLAAGRHRVRAVSPGGKSQSFGVTIQPGKEAPPRRLVW